MAIRNERTGRHIWYEADHGIQRDPLRDAIRDKFPTSRDGWNVNDVDLRVCLFGDVLGRPKNEDGWIIEFEAKKNNANLKYAQIRTMVLIDNLATKSDPKGMYWGGCWLLQVPDNLENGIFLLNRPLNKKHDACIGINQLSQWIKSMALQSISQTYQASKNYHNVPKVP